MSVLSPEAHGPALFAPGPFEFVLALATELSTGDVKLPSFPDIAARVRRVLDDQRATPAQVAQIVGSDAALAARVIRIANSATFNAAGQPITGLQAAIGRLGHELVRCAAVSFALGQVRQAAEFRELRPQLQELWRTSTLVAAIAHVVARETKAAHPDEGTVAGLLHNVGRLYIVARAAKHAASFQASGAWDAVLRDWHPQIGRSVLEHWRFPEAVVVAVAEQNAWDRPRGACGVLADVLVAAIALVPCVYYRELIDETVPAVSAFGRLGLGTAQCRRLLADSARQIRQLRDALAG